MSPGLLVLLAGLGLAAGILAGPRWSRGWLGFTVGGSLAGFGAAMWVLVTGTKWEWRVGLELGGSGVHLLLDGVSAFFLMLLSFVGGVITLYAHEYWTEKRHPVSARSGRTWWCALLLFMGLVLVSANGLHFLMAWELFAVCAYFLITRERHLPRVREAGWLYLVASHAGTLCLFAFFAGLAAKTGSWEIGPMRDRTDLSALFWLALAGFGLKAGLFPIHIWLPSAHANAPSHVSAILSGVAIKMGIYGLVRFTGWLTVPPGGAWVVVGLGVASAVLGVAFALGQHDLKRLLAYHSVENIGIICIGLGFSVVAREQGNAVWGNLVLMGGLLHVLNHGLFKALLFLGAGSVVHATGTREMSRLGGLWRVMPWTAGCFALGAAAISGLPPLNGFVSELFIYLGMFGALEGSGHGWWGAVASIIALAITGALALACFVKAFGVVFLGLPRSVEAERGHECGPLMRMAMLMLSGACVMIGLGPVLVWPVLQRVAVAWTGDAVAAAAPGFVASLSIWNTTLAVLAVIASSILLRRVRRNGVVRAGTWDCGYARPTARMQYTAGSFAEIITGWFEWILRPTRHIERPAGAFPVSASHFEHTPETVLEKVIEPAGSVIMKASGAVRRLQHGRLQFYILYLVLGLAALALLSYLKGAM